MKQISDAVFAQVRDALKHGITRMNILGEARPCMPLHEALAALDTAQPVQVNAMLVEALERMVESVTGVDQVSAVNEARAALTAAKQAQPEPVNQVLLKALSALLTHSGMDEDEWSKPTFDQARAAIMLATTKTQECGMCGYVGTKTDAVGQCPRCHWDELQAQPERAPLSDAEIEDLRKKAKRNYCIDKGAYFKAFRDAEQAHGIKQGGQHD